MEAEPTRPGDRSDRARSFQSNRRDIVKAMLTVTSKLQLRPALHAIVRSSMDLVDARFGALWVSGDDNHPSIFIHEGVDDETLSEIGSLPTGRGVLGLLTTSPGTVRIPDLRKHPAAIGFPPDHPEMTTFLGTTILVRGSVYGHLYLTEKEGGGSFSGADETIIETLALAAEIAIDNARNYEQAQSRLRWIEATRDIRTELLAGSDDLAVLGLIARTLRELAGADLVFVAQPVHPAQGEEITHLVVTVAAGAAAEEIERQTIPVAGSTSGAAFATQQPYHGDHLAYAVSDGVTDSFGPVLAAPMRALGHTRGVLVALRAAGRPMFAGDVVDMTVNFADQAALALHLDAAATQTHQLRLFGERERIAQDLHDHVIQRLFAEGLSLQVTLRNPLPPDVRDRLTRTVENLQDIIQDIRSTVYDLQSSDAPSVRLRERIHEVIGQQLGDTPLRTHLRLSGPLSVVDRRTAEHILAVIRESASNIVRHARATSVTVTVSIGDDIVVEISDDGIGLADDIHPSGLANLRRRAESLGGTMSARSLRGGTTVRWSVPLK